jgi:hypothetical protein
MPDGAAALLVGVAKMLQDASARGPASRRRKFRALVKAANAAANRHEWERDDMPRVTMRRILIDNVLQELGNDRPAGLGFAQANADVLESAVQVAGTMSRRPHLLENADRSGGGPAAQAAGLATSPARSRAGRLRNVRAMTHQNLLALAREVRGAAPSDPEGARHVHAELVRRVGDTTRHTAVGAALRESARDLDAAIGGSPGEPGVMALVERLPAGQVRRGAPRPNGSSVRVGDTLVLPNYRDSNGEVSTARVTRRWGNQIEIEWANPRSGGSRTWRVGEVTERMRFEHDHRARMEVYAPAAAEGGSLRSRTEDIDVGDRWVGGRTVEGHGRMRTGTVVDVSSDDHVDVRWEDGVVNHMPRGAIQRWLDMGNLHVEAGAGDVTPDSPVRGPSGRLRNLQTMRMPTLNALAEAMTEEYVAADPQGARAVLDERSRRGSTDWDDAILDLRERIEAHDQQSDGDSDGDALFGEDATGWWAQGEDGHAIRIGDRVTVRGDDEASVVNILDDGRIEVYFDDGSSLTVRHGVRQSERSSYSDHTPEALQQIVQNPRASVDQQEAARLGIGAQRGNLVGPTLFGGHPAIVGTRVRYRRPGGDPSITVGTISDVNTENGNVAVRWGSGGQAQWYTNPSELVLEQPEGDPPSIPQSGSAPSAGSAATEHGRLAESIIRHTSSPDLEVRETGRGARIVQAGPGRERTVAHVHARRTGRHQLRVVQGSPEEIEASGHGLPDYPQTSSPGVHLAVPRVGTAAHLPGAAAAIDAAVASRGRAPRPARGSRGSRRVRAGTILPGMAGTSETAVGPPRDGEDRIFGIENEIMGVSHQHARDAMQSVGLPVATRQNYTATHMTAFLATEDVSIANNPEIKSPPLYGEDGHELLRKAIEALSDVGGRQGPQAEYGLHVHVDVRDLDASQREAAGQSYQNNRRYIEELIGVNRRRTSWARQGVGGQHGSYREVISNAHRDTIEFRRMGSNLNAVEVEVWIRLLKQIINKAKERGTAMPTAQSLQAFMQDLGLPPLVQRALLSRAAGVRRYEQANRGR